MNYAKNKYTEEEKQIIIKMYSENATIEEIAEAVNHTISGVKDKIYNMPELKQYKIMRNNTSRRWTSDDEKLLRKLWKDPNLSDEALCKKMGRTLISVRNRAGKLYLGSRPVGCGRVQNIAEDYWNKDRKYWTDEEINSFSEDWCDPTISNNVLRKRYKNRSMTALQSQAARLGLGGRYYDDSYLKISDIVKEMKVSKDRVRGWIKKGLKTHKSKTKTVHILIDQNELLDFLKDHPDLYDASQVSFYLFSHEPEWFKQKRQKDKMEYDRKAGTKWSDEELNILIKLFKRGYSNKELAKQLQRSETSIEKLLWGMGLSRKGFNDYEVEIIKKNIDKLTLSEIIKMLPYKNEKQVIAKCKELNLKYRI